MSVSNQGAGNCPAGNCPGGFGTPAQTNSSTASLLVQADGTQGNCVFIDPTTGDYRLDAKGQKQGWDSLNQKVYLALRTVLGSSAVPTLGIVQVSGVIGPDFVARIQGAVRTALKSMTDAHLIIIVDIVVTRIGTSAVERKVLWRAVPGGPVQSTFV